MNFDWVSPESSPHALRKQMSRKPKLAAIKILRRITPRWLQEVGKIPRRIGFIFVRFFFEEVRFRGAVARKRTSTGIRKARCEPDSATSAV